jgi:glycosyltransferase involved in cell wall biosynthesis
VNQIDVREAERRIADREDVEEAELQSLLGGDSHERQTAALALVRTYLRRALDAAAQLAANQSYADQGTLTMIQQLAPLADDELPLIEPLKGLGVRAVSAGRFEEAMRFLQDGVHVAGRVGQRHDRRSRSALRYLHDEEIDRALARLSQVVRGVTTEPPPPPPRRIALLVAGLVEDNAPTVVTLAIAQALREFGNDVRVVSAEFGPSNPVTLSRFRERGFGVVTISAETYREKIDRIVAEFDRNPVHATVYLGTPSDHVSKVVSEAGLSRTQFFMNICYEPYVGKFDYVFQTVSPEQETVTAWPGRSKYVGSFVGLGPAIDAAQPIDRATLGVRPDALILGTYGRLVKCSNSYIEAVRTILEADPRAELLLAGPVIDREIAALNSGFAGSSAGQRVHVLGPRQGQVPALLRATDVYLDSFPWPGGQSVLEAMWAGLPIVAMRHAPETSLDPLSIGPTSSTSERFLPREVELAPAGDVDAYVRLALAYLRDPARRRRDGTHVREHVLRHYSHDGFMQRLNGFVTGKIDEAFRS